MVHISCGIISVSAGGYIAGRADLVEAAACRLTAPGIGSAGGATFAITINLIIDICDFKLID